MLPIIAPLYLRDDLYGRHLWLIWRLRQYCADGEFVPDFRDALNAWGNLDLARHRRNRLDHRHGR